MRLIKIPTDKLNQSSYKYSMGNNENREGGLIGLQHDADLVLCHMFDSLVLPDLKEALKRQAFVIETYPFMAI